MAYKDIIAAETGLVSWWRLGETTGTSAADSKGANTGTYNGGFTLNAAGAIRGDSDGSVTLDGTSGYVSVPSAAGLHPASVTVEGWFYFTAAQNDQSIISSNTWTAGDIGYVLKRSQTGSNGPQFGTYKATGAGWTVALDPGSNLSQNAWHHLVGTYDGSNIILYRDGVAVATTAYTTALGYQNTEFRIGRGYDTTTGGYQAGSYDEVAIYNVALTAAQVKTHYEWGLFGKSFLIQSRTSRHPLLRR